MLLRSKFPLPPLELSHGAGSWIFDTAGRRYFDASSGSLCVNVGHAHPTVLQAIQEQSSKVAFATAGNWHFSRTAELAERLVAFIGRPGSAVMFSTTGTSANELAIHL